MRSVGVAGARRLETVMIALIFLAGLWFFFGQLVLTKFDAVPGDLGDSRFNAIVLEHGYRYLGGDGWHRPLWSPKWSFFPHKDVLAYSDNLFGTLPLYVLARCVGLGELAAFDTWVVILTVANFASMVLLLRELGLSRLSAALGGFVFAFAMPRGQQLNHLQLFPQFFTPLCFFCLVKMRGLRPWTAYGAVGCAVLQLYAAIYVGWFLALALGIGATVTALIAVFSRDFRNSLSVRLRRLWLHAIAAALVGMVVLLPLGFHYMRALREVGPRNYDEISGMLPRVTSYLLPADYTALYHPWMLKLKQGLPVAHEQVMFAGFLVMLSASIMLVSLTLKPRRIAANAWNCVWIAIWLGTVFATLFVNGSLWNVLHRVIPGGGAIRAVSRVVLLQLLPLGAATAWVANWIEKRAGVVVAALFAVLVVVENSGAANYHFSAREQKARIDRTISELAAEPCAAFVLTGTEPSYITQIDAMWASLETQTPTLNGYSGNSPRKWQFDEPDVTPKQLRSWLIRHHTWNNHVCVFRH